LKEDFRDYFWREGIAGYIKQEFLGVCKLQLIYRRDTYESMQKNTNWALFGKGKNFRSNFGIDEGKTDTYLLIYTFDTTNGNGYAENGWNNVLVVERMEPREGELKDQDYTFTKFDVIVTRYNRPFPGNFLDFRIWYGYSADPLPHQSQYALGGIGTLRGFRFKEFAGGDKMLLLNAEYRMELKLGGLQGAFFVDSGEVFRHNEEFDIDRLHTNVGVGIQDSDGDIRLDIAKAIKESDSPVRFTFRLNRTF
jgi:outer membrane protein assembly factor BamA